MKGRIILFFTLMLAMTARAEVVEVDGFCYNLLSAVSAEVAAGSSLSSGEVTIPASFIYNGSTYQVEAIGNKAFQNCTGLTKVVLPEGVLRIGGYAFSGCKALAAVVFPESLTSIQAYAFSGCTSLKTVTVPNRVELIGAYAFMGCSKLAEVSLGSGLKELVSGAFNNCTSLHRVNLVDLAAYCGVKVAGSSLVGSSSNPFKYATTLSINGVETKELVIPDGVAEISDCAFFGCNAIESLVVPNSVERIGKCSFFECRELSNIELGEGVQTIDENAFDGCTALGELSLPDKTTTIGNYAFNRCNSLTEVVYGRNLETIGNLAFCNCSSISAIELPGKVETIGTQCFYACSQLATVTLPASITSIGDFAFRDNPSLSDVYCYATTLPTASDNVFMNSSVAQATLHVPESVLSQYQASTPWSYFGKLEAAVIETPRCATPTITYRHGKLSFFCETEGAQCVSKVSFLNSDENFIGRELQLVGKFRVSVYAQKEGYLDSEETVKEFDLSAVGDVNGDGQITIADVTDLVNVILGKE